jgi:uncharacterized membrane-anchored protein YitT (DUF2179 family)
LEVISAGNNFWMQSLMIKKLKTEIINYFFIMFGSLALSLGIVGFLSPNNIATGGTAGLAILLHHVFNKPIGQLMAMINIPLLLVSLKYLGKQFAIKTIVCIVCIVVSVDLLGEVIHVPNMSHNLMLATLYGGIAIGIGLGFIFKGGASAGGGTILAKIIAANSSIKTSTVVLILDAAVVASAGFVFQSIELALWSLISIYVASKLIDTVLVGGQGQKIVHISSSKNMHQLSLMINEALGVSGTLVTGDNLAATEHKDIIFLLIEKNKLNALKQLVGSYDEDIKMIVMEAVEVLGKEKNKF